MTKKIKDPAKTKLIKRIVFPVAIALLIVLIVVANYFINYYSLILNRFFAGDNVDTSTAEAQEVFSFGDDVVRSAAAESMVLLENKGGYLPKSDLKKVNLFGDGSTEYGFLLTGGGSGGTSITDEKDIKVDLDDAFISENIEINRTLYNAYVEKSRFDADYRATGTTGANAAESLITQGASFYTDTLMSQAKSYSDVAVAVVSRWGAENGGDQELKKIGSYDNGTFLELTSGERAMFDALQANNFEVIVVANVCNNLELGFVKDYSCIKACIFAGIPGQSGAVAIPQIITGKVNPSGRMSDTLAYDYQTNNPVYPNAAKTEWGNSIVYQEGIYFGYKWYETADAEGFFSTVSNSYGNGYDGVVQYPFGYGLSYTTFDWTVDFPDDTALDPAGNYEVKVTVKNTGAVAGKDVVQLYGHTEYINGGIEKPERTLLDFEKTPLLEPGDDCELTLKFSTYDLASYDEYDKNSNGFTGYELDAGSVDICVMSDAHTLKTKQQYDITSAVRYAKDLKTGNPVVNRFTGSKAYAKCPIDGSTAYSAEIPYLSRAGGFSNYSAIVRQGDPTNTSVVDAAAGYNYSGYNSIDASDIQYGKEVGLYLVRAQKGDGDNAKYSKATASQLTGGDSAVKLAYNTQLLEILRDYDSPAWEPFLNQLTQSEVKTLIGEAGFTTSAVVSVGKIRCTDKDGPAGFNNNVTNAGKSSIYTLYPSESLLGCSWNKETARSIGIAQGKIGSELGINGWYGPGINLHRSVYNSRNYEYFSEDATLSGLLAAAVIDGAKENHLYCYLKHFAVSEAGQNPKNLNTWLTEQTMREHYLRAFEIAVKNSGANAIMSAFNRVGAVLAGYNHAMLTDILRGEWGFRGSVITDWYDGGGYMESHTKGVLGGNDLWLCGTTAQPAKLNLASDPIKYAARQSVKNILYTYIDTYADATAVKVNAESESALFTFIWVIINVVIGLGLATCTVFLLLTFEPIKKALCKLFHIKYTEPVTVAASAAGTADSPAEAPSDAADGNADGNSDNANGVEELSTAEQNDAPAFCMNCGAPLRPGKKFCIKCGTKVKDD